MSIDRNSAAVVCNAHTVPRQKCYFDVVRESAHRLIARVVKDFPDEVMKAGGPRRPNVHARASTHCFQPFKNCNVFSSVPGSECWRRLFVDFFLSHGSCNDKIKKRYFRGSRARLPRAAAQHPITRRARASPVLGALTVAFFTFSLAIFGTFSIAPR